MCGIGFFLAPDDIIPGATFLSDCETTVTSVLTLLFPPPPPPTFFCAEVGGAFPDEDDGGALDFGPELENNTKN